MNDTALTAEHLCPRRAEAVHQFPGPDRWDNRGGLIGQDEAGLSCSYCGSLNPDRFMELVREGWQVGPTDKSYKAYLKQPITDEDRAARKTAWMNDMGVGFRTAALNQGVAPEQADATVEEVWRTGYEPYLTGKTRAKFYFQHLSPEQQDEFIRLHNAKQMNVGDPGYFYAKPYFCGTGEATT